MTYRNILLTLMIICYLFPMYYVYYNFTNNNSVSNIICDEKCKQNILIFMVLMGIATILYEIERKDIYSQILILILLIGIYGLVYIDETYTAHYIFAFQVFISILLFMIRHTINHTTKQYPILNILTLFQIVLLILIVINIQKDIFYEEVAYILNFALYYIYLHFTNDLIRPPIELKIRQ